MERKNRATLVTGLYNDNQAIVERIKQLPEIEEVLSVNNPLIPRQGMLSMNYKDWEDKANDALKGGSESAVFAKSQTNRQKLKAKYASLNI